MIRMPFPSPTRNAVVDLVVQLVSIALLAYWAAILVKPFVTIIAWSIILAIVLFPAFNWMVGRLHLPRLLAALIITVFCLLVLFGPAAWLGLSLAGSLQSIAKRLAAGDIAVPPPPDAVKDWLFVGHEVHALWELASTNLKDLLTEMGPQLRSLSTVLLALAKNTAISMLNFVAAVLISGFVLSPGPELVGSARAVFRKIAATRGDEFVDLIGATIRSLARAVIGLSLLQALLAGVGFMIAGVPAAGLLSFLILLLGIIQIDAAVVTIPVLIWSWLKMDTTAALFFTIYIVPVTFLNNFLRPFVMARGLKTPTLVVFVGMIGGLFAHGLIGLFIGPVVLAIAWELPKAWTSRATKETNANAISSPDSVMPPPSSTT